jgi:hypothetical protein
MMCLLTIKKRVHDYLCMSIRRTMASVNVKTLFAYRAIRLKHNRNRRFITKITPWLFGRLSLATFLYLPQKHGCNLRSYRLAIISAIY